MSSPTPAPAPKRRKTSALFKPFKSPLKTPLTPSSNSVTPPPASANDLNGGTKHPYHPSPLSTTTSSSAKPSATNPPPHANPTSPAHHLSSSSPASSPASHPSPISPTTTSLPALHSHHTSLALTHTRLLSTLDTHTQALKIESSAKDAELARLIALWRLAARQAAEEIFAGVRDRVNRMGGVGAWREREREGRERWGGGGGGGWDDGGERTGLGEGEDEEEGVEERREREGGEESDRVQERRRVEGEAGEDEGFTMDMMLKSLNIELGVIGYDKEMQRWID
ncbi:hypothetical protein MMC11_007160 [Xylographa trunciseda]|nr:hypothetical protein [Xylographa trunciseda]